MPGSAKPSKSSKKGEEASESLDAVPFETALKKLETIVEAMEEGDLPLESLLARYEEGTKLVAACQSKLEVAEEKIKTLEQSATGAAVLEPVDMESAEDENE